ncbi:MAG: AmmeMemoRadiSam system protein B [Deltaproteobacteria bacterium]|nr:AmmeMemoRadiSam system protein B [Candidatus Zymogenaceae bacterium]
MNRKPAVAGQFYPLDPKTLQREVSSFLEPRGEKRRAVGVVSPHAGYVYSGKIAGMVFSRVVIPPSVVILGPNHRGVGGDVAVAARGSWEMPSGLVPIDEDLARTILESSKSAVDDERAHALEHSLEVQVPFIQAFRPDFRLVPIALGRLSLPECLAFGRDLAAAISQNAGDVLIVASSDMTHYEPAREAEKKDRMVIDRMLNLDPDGVYETVRDNRITMCGVIPVTIMLAAAKELGASTAELAGYMTSGDTSGDYGSVVGYAGVIVR